MSFGRIRYLGGMDQSIKDEMQRRHGHIRAVISTIWILGEILITDVRYYDI